MFTTEKNSHFAGIPEVFIQNFYGTYLTLMNKKFEIDRSIFEQRLRDFASSAAQQHQSQIQV